MTDDLIRRKDALNFEITVEGPREAEEAILRTSQGIMDYIKSLPAVTREDMIVAEYWGKLAFKVRELLEAQDIVKVVRCNDCKYRDADDFCTGRGYPNVLVPDDGFCDKGKRRE